jgi:hypothetical protein
MIRKLIRGLVCAALAFAMFEVQVQAEQCKKHSECGPGEGCENGVCVKKL